VGLRAGELTPGSGRLSPPTPETQAAVASSVIPRRSSDYPVFVATYSFQWRGEFANEELNALHAEAFAHPILSIDWIGQVQAHSLGWVTARESGELIGFVNVPWDGAMHAFIVDTIVSAESQRHGIGTRLVDIAAHEATAVGCAWLHVDFDEEHRAFYLGRCGFRPTAAGLRALGRQPEGVGAVVR